MAAVHTAAGHMAVVVRMEVAQVGADQAVRRTAGEDTVPAAAGPATAAEGEEHSQRLEEGAEGNTPEGEAAVHIGREEADIPGSPGEAAAGQDTVEAEADRKEAVGHTVQAGEPLGHQEEVAGTVPAEARFREAAGTGLVEELQGHREEAAGSSSRPEAGEAAVRTAVANSFLD